MSRVRFSGGAHLRVEDGVEAPALERDRLDAVCQAQRTDHEMGGVLLQLSQQNADWTF